jgi:Tfp pilus assembly protein PilN
VINFTLGRFKESPNELILIAPGLERDLQPFLESRFRLPVVPLQVPGWEVTPQWFVALGAAFRGTVERGEDRELSVASVSSAELFYEEQLFDFIRLWRMVIAGVLGVLLIFFGGAAYFLSGQARAVQQQLESFKTRSDEKELQALEAKAVEFNALVDAVGAARAGAHPWGSFLEELSELAAKGQVKIDHLVAAGSGELVTLTARAPSYEGVVAFKKTLEGDSRFANVALPVSQISTLEDGSVGFTIVFGVRFSGTP